MVRDAPDVTSSVQATEPLDNRRSVSERLRAGAAARGPRPLHVSRAGARAARPRRPARLPRGRRSRRARPRARGDRGRAHPPSLARVRGRVPRGGFRDARGDRAVPRHRRGRLPAPHRRGRHRRPARLRARPPDGAPPRWLTSSRVSSTTTRGARHSSRSTTNPGTAGQPRRSRLRRRTPPCSARCGCAGRRGTPAVCSRS